MYRLGLDIGIKSVGWCVLNCDSDGNPYEIAALNSRIFNAAENPKDGASLAEPRREARSARRRLRRRCFRLKRIRDFFESNNIYIFKNDVENIELKDEYRNIDIIELREKALTQRLSNENIARILYSLAKRRGYQSNSTKDTKEEEKKKVLTSIKEIEKKLSNYKTVGSYLFNEYHINKKPIHNKDGKYNMCVSRDMIRKEIDVIFDIQYEFGNIFCSQENKVKFLEIFNSQRNFDEGPGKGSPYSGLNQVRKCEIYKEEDVAAKGTYTNEWCTIYQKINNLRITSPKYEQRSLTDDEKKIIVEKIKSSKNGEIKYSQIRNLIKMEENERFNTLSYSTRISKKKTEQDDIFQCEGSVFASAKNSQIIRNKLPESLRENVMLIDQIAEICTRYSTISIIKEKLEQIVKISKDETIINNLINLDLKGYSHLSLKALKEILPYLENGDSYYEAMKNAGHDSNNITREKTILLGKNTEVQDIVKTIASPVAKRAITQTIKVIDAIIREYGSPYAINIELARDFSKDRKERDAIQKDNQEKEKINKEIRDKLIEFKINATPINILKYKLYEEQNQKCIYSGESININDLFAEGMYEIDHIIPYSRSFDDSFNNKVLVKNAENQNKKNMIPYEYFSVNGRNYEDFISRCEVIYKGKNQKKLDLLKKQAVDENVWKNRALNDTRYASRVIANMIKGHLIFAGEKKHTTVQTVKGGITAYVRKQWGIQKIREDGDIHHAIDAAVIACVNKTLELKIETYNKYKENSYFKNGLFMVDGGELVDSDYFDKHNKLFLPYPYEMFRKELKIRTMDDFDAMKTELKNNGFSQDYINKVKYLVISRMPDRKGKGPIHNETNYSIKYINNTTNIHNGENIVVHKTQLNKLKLDKNTGEIVGYFNPESDIKLYNLLKNRLLEYDGDAKKAFADDKPVYKPSNNGNGALVRSVKTYEKYTGSGVILRKINAVATNGKMFRVDLYSKNNKYYVVPVYVSDLYAKQVPQKAVVAHKPYSDWLQIDDSYKFEFSIYRNDLLNIKTKNEIDLKIINVGKNSALPINKRVVGGLFYFNSMNISSGSFTIFDTNGAYEKESLGIQGLPLIKKYDVDILGHIYEVKNKQKSPMQLKINK